MKAPGLFEAASRAKVCLSDELVCEHLASHLAHLHLPCTYLPLHREQLGAGGDGVLGALPTIHTSVAEGGALKQLRPALDTLAGEGRGVQG